MFESSDFKPSSISLPIVNTGRKKLIYKINDFGI